MFRFILVFSLFVVYSFSYSQHHNVLISTQLEPEEPTICINPLNTQEIVAAANLRNMYYSSDGGQSWHDSVVGSPYGVWGDPCIVVDTAGDFYFFHLSNPANTGHWIDRIVCQKSFNSGRDWTAGKFMGFNGAKYQDKEWATIDRKNNNIYVSWTEFDNYGSASPEDSSRILFSKSVDGGDTWLDPPIKINEINGDCVDDDNTVEGCVPAVGPNGEIYAAWAGPVGLVFDKSLDEGNSWLEDDIFVCDIPGGWNYDIPGISRCNGLPVTKCDTSGSDFHGNIYINWTDQRNGTDDTDVWLVRSEDAGETWTVPIRVNDDQTGNQQFFTWMDIDQANGNLYFVFYDRRNHNDETTDVFMALSKDGGQTFTNFKISESPFYPISNVFFGDYTNVSAYNNVVRPIWARLDSTELSIYTAIIDIEYILNNNERDLSFSLMEMFPNPAKDLAFCKVKLNNSSNISLYVFDIYGRKIATLAENENYTVGKHLFGFDSKMYGIEQGIFYFNLIVDNQRVTKKMIVQ